jgi:hypothetical protein
VSSLTGENTQAADVPGVQITGGIMLDLYIAITLTFGIMSRRVRKRRLRHGSCLTNTFPHNAGATIPRMANRR